MEEPVLESFPPSHTTRLSPRPIHIIAMKWYWHVETYLVLICYENIIINSTPTFVKNTCSKYRYQYK